MGLELGAFALSALGVVALVRLVVVALRLGHHPSSRPWLGLVALLWCLACIVACALLLYLWRRVGTLSTALAMLTDHGRVARLGGRPPVWLDAAPRGGLTIAHLSDLHLAEDVAVRMVERLTPAGNAQLEPLLDAASGSELIVFTGDITDRGSAGAWRRFLDALEARGLERCSVLVPGNHDLAYLDVVEGRRAWRHDRFGIVQLANLLKFADAFADTAGGRLGFVACGRDILSYRQAWAEVEREVRPLVAGLPKEPVPPLGLRRYRRERGPFFAYRQRIDIARSRLLQLFPVAVPIPGRDAILFVLNSSTNICRHPASNAIGCIGRAQYTRLETLARELPRAHRLVALHHHVVRRGEEAGADFRTRLMAKFTVLSDSRPLVSFCRRYQVRAVMNGHRHLSYQLRLPNGTVLLAAPSSTLGDELAGDPRPQFERYHLADKSDGVSVGIYREVVRIDRDAPHARGVA